MNGILRKCLNSVWIPPFVILVLVSLLFLAMGWGVAGPWKTAWTVTDALINECFWNYEDAIEGLSHARPAHIGAAIQVDIWNRELHRRAGMSAFLAGQFETALTHFKMHVTDETTDYFMTLFQGMCHQKIGNFETTLQLMTRAIDIAPLRQDAYIARGHCYMQINDRLSAYADYSRALTIGEKLPFVYIDVGDAFRFYGDWNTARELYTKAATVDIADPFTMLRLAEIRFYFEDNRLGAEQLLNQILMIQPSWDPAYVLRALINSGNPAEPDTYLSTASFADGPVKSWDLATSKLLFEFQREDWRGYR